MKVIDFDEAKLNDLILKTMILVSCVRTVP